MRLTRLVFIAALIVLLALSANGLYFMLVYAGNMLEIVPEPISYIDFNDNGYSADILLEAERLESPKSSEISEGTDEASAPVNIMVLGLDRDKTRCDVIMLINFDPVSLSLNMLSIARDTRILTGRVYRKINATYSRGGEKRVAREISRITGLPVHYYITADFEGFRKIIDALGGVKFYVPFRMDYDDPTQNLHIHLKKGMQLLNGKKSEQLVRYRKGNYKGQGYMEGDIGRIKMQQDFIKALIDQKLNINYILKIDDIFAIVDEHVKTNISISDISRYAGSAVKVRSDSIKTFVLPGESQLLNGVWWYVYDKRKASSIIEENFTQ